MQNPPSSGSQLFMPSTLSQWNVFTCLSVSLPAHPSSLALLPLSSRRIKSLFLKYTSILIHSQEGCISNSPKVEKARSLHVGRPIQHGFLYRLTGKRPSQWGEARSRKGKGSRGSGFSSEDTGGERRRNGEDWVQEWGHSVSGLECQDQKGDSVSGCWGVGSLLYTSY